MDQKESELNAGFIDHPLRFSGCRIGSRVVLHAGQDKSYPVSFCFSLIPANSYTDEQAIVLSDRAPVAEEVCRLTVNVS